MKAALKPLQNKTPAADGYAMPAEWAPHEATWLSWPRNIETWPGTRLAKVRDIYLQMLEALLPGEKVKLFVEPRAVEDVMRFLKPKLNLKNLIFLERVYEDSWIRDYGPTYVQKKDGSKAWCKWIFNAWGGKYKPLMEDTHLFEDKSLVSEPCFDAGLVLEGGSIEVNGAGVCLTTEQCLLNPNRNPEYRREDLEEILKQYLGVSKVLWLNEGIVGDDTDGHIDDIARFVDERTILAAYEEDESDENHGILKENWERLQRFEDAKGQKIKTVKFPMPKKVADGGVRLPASYANFLIANKAVLLPTYSDRKNDERAAKILKELFPKHEIVSIECTPMVYGLGAIHCVSQQEPR